MYRKRRGDYIVQQNVSTKMIRLIGKQCGNWNQTMSDEFREVCG